MTDSEKIAISIYPPHWGMMRDCIEVAAKGMLDFENYTQPYVVDVPLCRQYLNEYLAVAKPMLVGFQALLANDTPPLEISRNALKDMQNFDKLEATKDRFGASLTQNILWAEEKKFNNHVQHNILGFNAVVFGNLDCLKDVITISLRSARDAAVKQQEPPPLPS